MMERSIYIAGPMAGREDLNAPAFAHAAEKLSAEGWTVYDPVEIGEMYGTADEIQSDPDLLAKVVKSELGFVARADAIYLLDGWEKSVGAKRELLVALDCGLEIICETSMASHQDDCGVDEATPGRNWARDARVAGRGTKQATNLSTTKERES